MKTITYAGKDFHKYLNRFDHLVSFSWLPIPLIFNESPDLVRSGLKKCDTADSDCKNKRTMVRKMVARLILFILLL